MSSEWVESKGPTLIEDHNGNHENYNEFCKSKDCEHYIEWVFETDLLVSCKLIGQSNNIDDYPSDCIFIEEIVDIIIA